MSNLSPHACPCGCGFDNPHSFLVSQITMLEAWLNSHYWDSIKRLHENHLDWNFAEYLIDITSGGRCPGHHAEVTRCPDCKGTGKYYRHIPGFYGDHFGGSVDQKYVEESCPTCHGTGSTSPESYHLPRQWNYLPENDTWGWTLFNINLLQHPLHLKHSTSCFSLAADPKIMRRELFPCPECGNGTDITGPEDRKGRENCRTCKGSNYFLHNYDGRKVIIRGDLILDLAAMQAMTAFWEPIWQGGWHLYKSWIHCDIGPKRRW